MVSEYIPSPLLHYLSWIWVKVWENAYAERKRNRGKISIFNIGSWHDIFNPSSSSPILLYRKQKDKRSWDEMNPSIMHAFTYSYFPYTYFPYFIYVYKKINKWKMLLHGDLFLTEYIFLLHFIFIQINWIKREGNSLDVWNKIYFWKIWIA